MGELNRQLGRLSTMRQESFHPINLEKDILDSAKNRYKILRMVGVGNQPGIACLKRVAFWALLIAISALPLRAQKGGGAPSGSGGSRGAPGLGTVGRSNPPPIQPGMQPETNSEVPTPAMQPPVKSAEAQDESCFPWELPDARGASVSAIRLAVPSKARSDYNKACGALKKKKLSDAEQHARDAIQKYSNYGAAWVMLGQVLGEEQKLTEAHDACSQPIHVDPTYLPPYLCQAGLLDQEKQWADLVTWSDRFLGLNLTGDMYANYYRALGNFHLRNLPEAQKNTSKAIAIDTEHHQPGLYFLLAQIYGEQGDVVDAGVQIQQFLKYSLSRADKDVAKQYLSELQSQQSAK
jgi:TolA-binding protein